MAKFFVEGFGPSGIEEREFDTLEAAVEGAYWDRLDRRRFAQVVTIDQDGRSRVVLSTYELAAKMREFGRTVEP
jgi:hypothetical protein